MKDLVVLVADKDMEQTLQGLLGRYHSLGIRQIEYDVFIHPRRDPGCLNEAQDFLRPLSGLYSYALVLFDREGCGREHSSAGMLMSEVRGHLTANGWPDRAEVIVFDPELEVWAWSQSPHVVSCLGWGEQVPSLRHWLDQQGFWPPDSAKPPQPKEAMEAALRHVRRPRSSAIYLDLAQKVSLQGHTEPAFLHFGDSLRQWFAL